MAAMRWMTLLITLAACSENVPVWVVNGLDVAVDANVNGKHITVAANGHAMTMVKSSKFWIVVSGPGGVEVDRETIKRRTNDRPVVFNVLGAAPLAIQPMMYSFHGITMDKPGPSTDLPYQRVLEREDIDHYFEAPDKVPKGDKPGPVTKRVLRQRGQWLSTVQWLHDKRRFDDGIALATAVQAAQPEKDISRVIEQLQFAKQTRSSSGYRWVVQSPDEQARLYHEQAADGSCTMRCEEVGSGVEWTLTGCVATAKDHRFVSSGCARTVIVREQLPPNGFQPTSVALAFERGVLASDVSASSVSATVAADGTIRYMGRIRVGADGRNFEIPEINGVRLIPLSPQSTATE